MEHQEQRGEETLIEPKHITNYPECQLISLWKPLGMLRSPFFPHFGADSSTGFMETENNALGNLIDSEGRNDKHLVSDGITQHHSRISGLLLLWILSTHCKYTHTCPLTHTYASHVHMHRYTYAWNVHTCVHIHISPLYTANKILHLYKAAFMNNTIHSVEQTPFPALGLLMRCGRFCEGQFPWNSWELFHLKNCFARIELALTIISSMYLSGQIWLWFHTVSHVLHKRIHVPVHIFHGMEIRKPAEGNWQELSKV